MRRRAAGHTKLIPIVKHSMNSNRAARRVGYSLVGSMKSGSDSLRAARDPKYSRKASVTLSMEKVSRASRRKSLSSERHRLSRTSSVSTDKSKYILLITWICLGVKSGAPPGGTNHSPTTQRIGRRAVCLVSYSSSVFTLHFRKAKRRSTAAGNIPYFAPPFPRKIPR